MKTKKIFSALMAALILFAAVPASAYGTAEDKAREEANLVYTVVFDTNDGKDYGYNEMAKMEVSSGGKITGLPEEPVRPGYEFLGWCYAFDEGDNGLLWDFETMAVEDNITLWAGWTKLYTVVFDPNDGKDYGYNEMAKTEAGAGEKITGLPEEPIRPGYEFLGWCYAFDEGDNGLLWDFETMAVENNMTLWAGWKESDTGGNGNENNGGENGGENGNENNGGGSGNENNGGESGNENNGGGSEVAVEEQESPKGSGELDNVPKTGYTDSSSSFFPVLFLLSLTLLLPLVKLREENL